MVVILPKPVPNALRLVGSINIPTDVKVEFQSVGVGAKLLLTL